MVEQLRSRGTHVFVCGEAELHQVVQLRRVLVGQRSVLTLGDPPEEGGEVLSFEGHPQSAQLVDETPQRPHIALVAVLLPTPNLRRSVVGRPRLSGTEPVLGQLRDVHVSELGHILGEEHIGTFDVTMDNIVLVQSLEARQ